MTKATADRLSSVIDRCKHRRQQKEGVLVIRTIAMPADTNPAGDIFGGWLMSQMDLAAGNIGLVHKKFRVLDSKISHQGDIEWPRIVERNLEKRLCV